MSDAGKQSRMAGGSDHHAARQSPAADATARDAAARPVPGKRTLVEQRYGDPLAAWPASEAPGQPASQAPWGLAPALGNGAAHTVQALFGLPPAVQLRAERASACRDDPAAIQRSAERGIATPVSELPHRDAIQRAFGRHDISAIRAHVGGDAAASAREMAAQAYATGDHVVLGAGRDLFTVAHEAAHVVQQRGGVALRGGVGAVGDAYERHADEVASLVVQGVSAEALLDRHAGATGVSAAIPAGPVQRKVGFEAELCVPTLGPPPPSVDKTKLADGPTNVAPTPAIEQFLFGGRDYGAKLGENNHFALTADHNELQQKMATLWVALKARGYLLALPTVTASNLEYVGKPLDELALHCDHEFTQQLAAIATHAGALFPGARDSISAVAAPGANLYTGVPVDDLQRWLGPAYPEIADLVDDFRSSVKNEFYLQATVGIIPSAIRDLHQRHTPASTADCHDVFDQAMFLVDDNIEQLIALDEFKNHPYIQEMRLGKDQTSRFGGTTHKPARPIDYESFIGVLHLMLMYKVGSALRQTHLFAGDTTPKNTVPFLSKMANMRYIITSAAPSLQANRPPGDLVTYIDKIFGVMSCTSVDWWVSKGLRDHRGLKGCAPTVRGNFVSDMLAGNWMLSENWFGGNKPQVVGSGSPFHNPDQLPSAVSQASAGQQGAQFEYRHIQARPPASGLAAECQKVIDEVRILNLKHMPAQRQQEIVRDAEAPRRDTVIDV